MTVDHKKRADDMHRRAQAAEGELMRMKEAHRYATEVLKNPLRRKDKDDYWLYGWILLKGFTSLFPREIKK